MARSDRSQSRAREDEPDDVIDVDSLAAFFADHSKFPESREGRVQYCMVLMASGRWHRGKTCKDIAAATGLAVNSIEDISAEASRRVKSALNTEEARSVICAAALEGLRQAMSFNSEKGVSALASLLKVYADVTGAMAPKKHELTGKDGAQLIPGTTIILSDLSEEQLQAFVERGELPTKK